MSRRTNSASKFFPPAADGLVYSKFGDQNKWYNFIWKRKDCLRVKSPPSEALNVKRRLTLVIHQHYKCSNLEVLSGRSSLTSVSDRRLVIDLLYSQMKGGCCKCLGIGRRRGHGDPQALRYRFGPSLSYMILSVQVLRPGTRTDQLIDFPALSQGFSMRLL